MLKTYLILLPNELRESLSYYVDYKTLLDLYEFAEFSSILNSENFWKNKAIHDGYTVERWTNLLYYNQHLAKNPRYRYIKALSNINSIRPYGAVSQAVELEDIDVIKFFAHNNEFMMRNALIETIKRHKSLLFYELFDLYKDRLDKDQIERLEIEAKRTGDSGIITLLEKYIINRRKTYRNK